MTKISIIGRGLDPSKHLTLEAIQALKNAKKILGIESEKNFWNQLQKQFDLCEIEDISHLYHDSSKDIDNYNRFIDLIIQNTFEFEEIVLLVAGHPRLGVSFINMLKERLKETEIEIVEGISSFDVMLNELEIDPLEQGTAMLDANRILLFQYLIEPALCYFIYHICSVGTNKTHYLNPEKNNRVILLKEYLLKFYPANKLIYFCRMSNGRNEKSIKQPIALCELDKNLSLIDFSTTLYIPAENPSKLDFEYLELLR